MSLTNSASDSGTDSRSESTHNGHEHDDPDTVGSEWPPVEGGPSPQDILEDARGGLQSGPNFPDIDGEQVFSARGVTPLLALGAVAVADDTGVSGSGLIDAAERAGDWTLSPGTVYPLLKGYDEQNVLGTMECGYSKLYTVAEPAAADAILENYEARLRWLYGLCLAARAELDTTDTSNTGGGAPTTTDPDEEISDD